MRLGFHLLGKWICFIGLWFLFVYQLSLIELVAGAAAALATIVALELSLKVVPLRFQPKPSWLFCTFKLPAIIIQDMGILVRALAGLMAGKKIPSLFQVTYFSAAGEEGQANAKRTLAVAFTTVSPNSVVVGIDRKSGLVLFHELERTAVPDVLKELEK